MVYERYSKFLYTYQIFDIAAPLGEKSQTTEDECFAHEEFAFKENAKYEIMEVYYMKQKV